MNAPASAASHLMRRSRTVLADGFAFDRLRVLVLGIAVAGATAGAVTYKPLPLSLLVVGAAALAGAVVLFASPTLAAVMLGVSIPEIQDVTGGHLGVHVAASDIVLVLITARILADAVVTRRSAALRALRPVRVAVVQYAWCILILLVLHFGLGSLAKSTQRIELFFIPILVGAYVAIRRDHMLVLKAYVVATTLLAVAWPILNSHGLAGQFQKNPVGQMIVGAILLVIAVHGLRRLLPCLPLLLIGLALTASRGALLALVVGLVVLSVMYGGARRRIIVTRTLALVLIGVAIYPFLPGDVSARLTNYGTTTGAVGSYAIDIREEYDRDAEQLISEHPWTGVGVGNYLAGIDSNLTATTDPHEVILLEAAEGGYLFAASFIFLILGAAFALWRLRRVELAAVATAVLLATAAHGLVDVYWVRGTPILGFLLVGMVCGLAAQRRGRATA
jgi:hypothetical protein